MQQDALIEALEEQIRLKDECIAKLDALVENQYERIRAQHNELAELRDRIHQHELLYTQPWHYFFWRVFCWPFHPDNDHD